MHIIDRYLEFTESTEPPPQYHRWAFLSGAAARIGRNLWIPFGHGKIYPNMYVMLVGVPGTRKSTAINLSRKLLGNSGYTKFSYAKTTKQKFLLDLEDANVPKDPTGKVDWGKALEQEIKADSTGVASDNYICCDEFVDFIGINNIEFINLLTTLWDNLPHYDERLKNSKSVRIYDPTINLLGGITPTSFAQAMPAEVVGQGFLSRLILVYGEPPDKKITWPRTPAEDEYKPFIECFQKLERLHGEVIITDDAKMVIDAIYQAWENPDDIRLQYYGARRLTHLLKLCIVIAALNCSTDQVLISRDTVVEANTILSYTELSMHSALGEFGKAKNSEAAQKIVETLANQRGPIAIQDLWKHVCNDLDRITSLVEIISNLQKAGRVVTSQDPEGHTVVMIKKKHAKDSGGMTDYRKHIKEYEKRHELLTVRSTDT